MVYKNRVNPAVVFRGNTLGLYTYGEGSCWKWESSLGSAAEKKRWVPLPLLVPLFDSLFMQDHCLLWLLWL